MAVPHVMAGAIEVRDNASHLAWKRHDSIFRSCRTWCGGYRVADEFYVSEFPPFDAAAVAVRVVFGDDGSLEGLAIKNLKFDQVEMDRVAGYSGIVDFPDFNCIQLYDFGRRIRPEE